MRKKYLTILLSVICTLLAAGMTGCAKNVYYDNNKMLTGQALEWFQTQTDEKILLEEAQKSINKKNEPKNYVVSIKRQVRDDYISVEAEIGDENGYKQVLEQIAELSDDFPDKKISINLDLLDSDTILYLDEIAMSGNIDGLRIQNGGVVTTKASSTFHNHLLERMRLYYIHNIEGDILKGLDAMKNLQLMIDSSFSENADLLELFDHSNCSDIMVYLEDNDDSGSTDLLHELLGQKELAEISEKEKRYLDAVYLVREDGYCYISYILKNEREDRHPHVLFYIEGEGVGTDTDTGGYFDILEILPDSENEIDVGRYEPYKMRIYDTNFDGYKDINFAGYGGMPSSNYYRFLWNPSSGKYEYCETAPSRNCNYDMERKRLTYCYFNSTFCIRYIYTFENGEFFERMLDVNPDATKWDYYENGKLMESLLFQENNAYILTNRDGEQTEGVFIMDLTNPFDVEEKFFPDFDFIDAG